MRYEAEFQLLCYKLNAVGISLQNLQSLERNITLVDNSTVICRVQSADFLDSNRFKLLFKISLDDIEISKGLFKIFVLLFKKYSFNSKELTQYLVFINLSSKESSGYHR